MQTSPYSLFLTSVALTECYPFALPDGRSVDMLPCARVFVHRDAPGTARSQRGGIILRGVLTPEELTTFEKTGKNPKKVDYACYAPETSCVGVLRNAGFPLREADPQRVL